MVVLGADTHKRNHTVVAIDEAGVEIGSTTVEESTCAKRSLRTSFSDSLAR